jgi:Fe2+ or Zn2+ uptake regulation protein
LQIDGAPDKSRNKQMTTKYLIIELLKQNRTGPMYKGQVCDAIRNADGTLQDTVARRLRELTHDGKIEKLEDEKGNTLYKIKRSEAKQVALL